MDKFNPVTYMQPLNTCTTSRTQRWGWIILTLLHPYSHRIPTQLPELTGGDEYFNPVISMQPCILKNTTDVPDLKGEDAYCGIQLKHQISQVRMEYFNPVRSMQPSMEFNWSTRTDRWGWNTLTLFHATILWNTTEAPDITGEYGIL